MDQSTGLVILSNLEVWKGNFNAALPSIMAGHVNIVGSEKKVTNFIDSHQYLIKGKDANDITIYLCQCGEAMLELKKAQDHWFQRSVTEKESVAPGPCYVLGDPNHTFDEKEFMETLSNEFKSTATMMEPVQSTSFQDIGTTPIVDPATGFLLLSELQVELGAYRGTLPVMMEGHVRLTGPGKIVPQFGCEHNYLIKGKDFNNANAYVCECGEAFLGLPLALSHIYETPVTVQPKSTEPCLVRVKQVDVGEQALTVSQTDVPQMHLRQCDNDDEYQHCSKKFKASHEASGSLNSDYNSAMEVSQEIVEDVGRKYRKPKKKENIPYHRIIAEALFKQFGYSFSYKYTIVMGTKLGISESNFRYLSKIAKSGKTEDETVQSLITPDVMKKAELLHEETVKEIKNVTTLKIPQTLKALRVNYGTSHSIDFKKLCAKKLNIPVMDVMFYFKSYSSDKWGSFSAEIHNAAKKLFEDVSSETHKEGVSMKSITNAPRWNSVIVEKRLIMEGIFLNQGLDLSVPYRNKCADELGVHKETVERWWDSARRRLKNVGDLEFKHLLTDSIKEKSVSVHNGISEIMKGCHIRGVKCYSREPSRERLILEAMLENHASEITKEFMSLCEDDINLCQSSIYKYYREALARQKNKFANPLTRYITPEITTVAENTFQKVMSSVMAEAEMKSIKDDSQKSINEVNKPMLVVAYLVQKHVGTIKTKDIDALATKLGVQKRTLRTYWKSALGRENTKSNFKYQHLITQDVVDEADELYSQIK